MHWDIRVDVRKKKFKKILSHRGIAPLGWIELLRNWKLKLSLENKRQRLKREDCCIFTYLCLFIFFKRALGAFLQTRIITSKGSSGKSPLRMYDMERYICCILFLISCRLQISPSQFMHSRVFEELRSACQFSANMCWAYACIFSYSLAD